MSYGPALTAFLFSFPSLPSFAACHFSIPSYLILSPPPPPPFSPAYLTESELSLQELTADSDHLISTLVQCLANPPDPDGDLTLDSHLEQFDKLCASVLLLLGSIGSNKEEIRCKVASEREMMRSLAHALGADDGRVKMAATR